MNCIKCLKKLISDSEKGKGEIECISQNKS